MVNYGEALKRPFSDIGKLVLGVIFSIIPIVNFMFSGYLLNVAKSAMNKKKELPEFEDYGKLFVDGLLAAVIGFIYMIPVFVVMLILMANIGVSILVNLFTSGTSGLISSISGLGLYFAIFSVVALVFSFIASAALLRFAEKRKFEEAFKIEEIAKKAFTGNYIIHWLLTVIMTTVIGLLLSLIPVVGTLLSIWIISVFSWTALAQIYSES